MMRLKDKVAIITGASRGIGYAVAEAFLREGAKVTVCGSRMESAERAATALQNKYSDAQIFPVAAEGTDGSAVEKMVAQTQNRWNKIDILVNNAGITDAKPVPEMTEEDFASLLRVNLTGTFLCIRESAGIMKRCGGGSIINTSSVVGRYGSRMQSAYAASKAGVIGLTKACAKEFGPDNIRVNAVAPGVVLTDMVSHSVTEQTMAGLRAVTPLQRAAKPEELAGAYVYLASDEASFTTGAVLAVDGGLVM